MLLLETICVENAKAQHLVYHNERVHKAQRDLFGLQSGLDLDTLISPPPQGIYRCRILYDREVRSVEYIPYRPKEIKKIALIASEIEYSYKYANREALDALLSSVPNCDDVLIYRKGLLRDTTIANVALKKDGQWFTPNEPLLAGTTRQRLIDSGLLQPKSIKIDTIESYDGFALMNAMIGFRMIKPIWTSHTKGK